jgi:hypothetical protein
MQKIKKITAYTGIVGNDGESRLEYRSSFQEFDMNNNLIKDVSYHPSGEIDSASGFKYDSEKRLKEEIHYFENDQVGEIIRYKLNAEGKPTEIETTYADESQSVRKISRFENMISVKSYDEDGELEGEELVKLNSDGRVVEEINFDEDQEIIQRTTNQYNEAGRVITKTKYGEDDEFLVKAEYDYDENGNIVSETQLNQKGKLINRINYTFDKNGNQIAWQNNNYSHNTHYDENGRIISEETVNRGNNAVENFTEFRYNPDGLKTEERTFSMGQQYDVLPGASGRSGSDLLVTRYEYEFFESEID